MITTTALLNTQIMATSVISNEGINNSIEKKAHPSTDTVMKNTMTLGGSKLKDRMMVIETMSKGGSKLRDRMDIAETMLLGGSKLRDHKIKADQIANLTNDEEKIILVKRLLEKTSNKVEMIEDLRLIIDSLSN